MKILTVATRVPQLDAKGDQLVAYHRLMALIRNGHQVELICCLISPLSAIDEAALCHLNSFGIDCKVVVIPWLVQAYNLFSTLFKPSIPFQSGLFRSLECQRLIGMQIRDFDPDVLHMILFRPYVNVTKIEKPLIVDFIDSVSLNYERTMLKRSRLLRPIFKMEASRARRYEHDIAKRAKLSFVVAGDDAQNIDANLVRVLHNGVDTVKFPVKREPSVDASVIFSGNMNYGPNIEAVSWFCRNCWPEINLRFPEAKFVICGANPSKLVRSLENVYPNVIVTGRVESVAAELGKSWVSIAPMQSGAGMQNKILEAMSCGLPVVTTTIGRGSIAADHGTEIIVSDSHVDFTKHVLAIINDSKLRFSIGLNARSYVSKNHDWNVIGQSFVASVKNILDESE